MFRASSWAGNFHDTYGQAAGEYLRPQALLRGQRVRQLGCRAGWLPLRQGRNRHVGLRGVVYKCSTGHGSDGH